MNGPVGNAAIEDLIAKGFVHASLGAGASGPVWDEFASSWSNLKPDTYMADGGKYRYRRYSEFVVDGATGAFELLPHVAYRQEKTVNHLNCGIDRLFDAFEPTTVESASLATAFSHAVKYLESARPRRTWKAQCFQNRILTTSNEAGQPAPEGIHRDGVDYVLTLFVDRVGADGGESSVYLAEDRSEVASTQLGTPGEYLFVNDHHLLHDVTALSLQPGADLGHRDVLIAMFTELPA